MRARWIRQQGHRHLVMFYSGWATETAGIERLAGDTDLLILSDYRDETFDPAWIERHDRITLVAYSMGVAVATRHLGGLRPDRAIAICGATDPRRTIGADIYDGTLAGLDRQRLARFARRAGLPQPQTPDIAALGDELCALRARPTAPPGAFDRIIAARKDRIFPADAMTAAWQGQPIDWVETGHFPFDHWQDWREITG
ncbi:alpha/beta fold hydrolase [Thioclava sp.]|uniref:alpha/beta fold hydrolase n=1 Tax=Thioclava sp. TaxID=1933450 RepID=UPI003243005E